MGGRRSTKQELMQLEAMTLEGLTIKEIARRLGRSEAGIRNLRYRNRLVKKTQNETKDLLQQRSELRNAVDTLQGRKTLLARELKSLENEKEKLESVINVDKVILQQTLQQVLMSLKQRKPDLRAHKDNSSEHLCYRGLSSL